VSSRQRRRSGIVRSRRSAVRAPGAGGRRLPIVPIVTVVGVAAVVGLIAYLIWQIGQPSSSRLEGAAEVEGDAAPDLPGEHVDLQGIYDGFYGNTEGNSTANHVSVPVDYSEQGLPPTGGPHWGSGPCGEDPADAAPFCGPAPWGVYRVSWETETLVHNLEHGGAVVWYNTTDQAIIDELEALTTDHLNDGDIVVMAPYPEMDEETIAVTSWARRDVMTVAEYTRDRVDEFLDVHVCRFNPEDLPGC